MANSNEAMREALEELMKFTCNCCQERYCEEDVAEEDGQRIPSPCSVIIKARDALNLGRRQCDVGTAEEQIKRWEKFCMEHHEYWKPSKGLTAIQRCNCPCYEGNGCNYFKWAQMPYLEGGVK